MKPGHRSLALLLGGVLVVSAASQWWAYGREQRQGTQLAALARPGDIRMLSSESCVYCAAARRFLAEHRVSFDECFIERDAQCKLLYEATQSRGTPTLIVRGKVQLGFDAGKVLTTLEAPGG